MVTIIKKILAVFIFVLFVNLVSAVPVVEINVSSHFIQGDIIKFSYTILSQQDETIKYFASISCPGSPAALLTLKEVNLEANKLFSGEHSYGIVDKNFQGGNCLASVSILEPYKLEFEKTFEVSAGVSKFSITPLICKDSFCIEEAKVFIQGEKIYMAYIPSIEGISIIGVLKFPDSSIKKITFPASILADKIGTYELNITASKKGYQDVNVEKQFGVIKENANIEYTNFVIQGNSNLSNEIDKQKNLTEKIIKYIVYFLVVMIILIIIIELIKRKKYREA